jgi:hypothetical protein
LGEVSKLSRNGLQNALGVSELGEFDSVKIVSILGDVEGESRKLKPES